MPRAPHDGSIRQRRDGRWEARIEIGGKRLSRYGATRAEAEAKLRDVQSLPLLAVPTPLLALRLWVEAWLAEKELRPSTEVTYRRTLAPILAELGGVALGHLTAIHLSATFALLRSRPRAAPPQPRPRLPQGVPHPCGRPRPHCHQSNGAGAAPEVGSIREALLDAR
jgi:hypothetical protein